MQKNLHYVELTSQLNQSFLIYSDLEAKLNVTVFIIVCVHRWYKTCVEARAHLYRPAYLLPCGSWDLICPPCQACWQVSLLTEQSCQCSFLTVYIHFVLVCVLKSIASGFHRHYYCAAGPCLYPYTPKTLLWQFWLVTREEDAIVLIRNWSQTNKKSELHGDPLMHSELCIIMKKTMEIPLELKIKLNDF